MEETLSIVLSTSPDEETAHKLARTLVADKLAACVQVLPKAVSFFSWEGKVNQEEELLIIIKTKKRLLPELERVFLQAHPYDVPELVTLEAQATSDYFNWLIGITK